MAAIEVPRIMPDSLFTAAYQPLIARPDRWRENAGPLPSRRSRRAVVPGCHYFSPVID